MDKISSKNITYSVAAFIISSSLLTKGIYSVVRNEAWIPTLLGIPVSLIILSIYMSLARKHPGSSLVEINDAVFGNIAGKLVSFLYFWFFLSLVMLNLNDLGNFISAMLLPNTPLKITYAFFILICMLAVSKGAVKLASYGKLFTIAAVIIILVHALLLINVAKPENLLPVFQMPLKRYLIGTQIVTMMPYCEILVFMMYYPYTEDAEGFRRGMIRGLLIGGVVLLAVVLRDTIVQGQFIRFSTLPTFSTIRLINIGDILTRLEIIYAITLMTLYFFKISTLFYGAVTSFCKMMKIKKYKYFIFIFGALVTVYTNAIFQSTTEHVKWKMSTAATYSTFFILVLPLLTLIVQNLRRGKRKDGLAAEN